MSVKAHQIFSYLQTCSTDKLRKIASFCDNPEDLFEINKMIQEREHRKRKSKASNSLIDFIQYTKSDFVRGWANEIICSELDMILDPDCDYDRLIIQCPPRLGKLLAHDTRVMTPDGIRLHGDLKIGDYVTSHNGEPIRVIGESPENVADIKINLDTGYSFVCHENHEWPVLNTQNSKIEVRETNEIMNTSSFRFIQQVKDGWTRFSSFTTERVGGKLGKCIEVDSKAGLYLLGGGVVTHNSECASRRFPAYALGKNPDLSVIATSYGNSLAQRMNRDVQRIIDSQEYQEIFPNTQLNGKNIKTSAKGSYIRTSDLFEIVGHQGAYRSAGIGGGITGQGASLLLIDDFFKDWVEAMSKTKSEKLWEWYNSTAYTRLSPDGKVVIIATRWSKSDLIGRLLEQAKNDPKSDQWRVVSLPMEYDSQSEFAHELDPRLDDGELLMPERFDRSYVDRRKFSLPPKIWISLYQQKPSVDGGNIFKRDKFKYYKELPEIEYKALSLDATFTDTAKSDFVAFGIWGMSGKNKYLIKAYKARLSFTDTVKKLYDFVLKHPDLSELIIEAKANGEAIINTLEQDEQIKIPIFPYKPTESKEARAWACTPQIDAGQVWLPDSLYEENQADWVEDYLDEMTTFPGHKYDDYVDMTTQFLNRVAKMNTGWFESLLHAEQFDKDDTTNELMEIMGFNRGGLGF